MTKCQHGGHPSLISIIVYGDRTLSATVVKNASKNIFFFFCVRVVGCIFVNFRCAAKTDETSNRNRSGKLDTCCACRAWRRFLKDDRPPAKTDRNSCYDTKAAATDFRAYITWRLRAVGRAPDSPFSSATVVSPRATFMSSARKRQTKTIVPVRSTLAVGSPRV